MRRQLATVSTSSSVVSSPAIAFTAEVASHRKGRKRTDTVAIGRSVMLVTVVASNSEPPCAVMVDAVSSTPVTDPASASPSLPNTVPTRLSSTIDASPRMHIPAMRTAPPRRFVGSPASARCRTASATASGASAASAMCGRTSAPPPRPATSHRMPVQRGDGRVNHATPRNTAPSVSCIHASLPMDDGQNTSDGRKNSSTR